MAADELGLAQLAQQSFRSNPQVFIFWHEEAQLVGEVEISFVVWRGGKHNNLTLVFLNVFLNCTVTLPLAVAQIVAFINQHEAVAAQIGQLAGDHADGKHLRAQAILVAVVFPHLDKVLRAEDKCLKSLVILKDACQRCRHQRFAQADYIADERAATLVEMVRGNFDRRCLELE